MNKLLLLIALIVFSGNLFAQSTTAEDTIKTTIITFFDGMRRADTLMMRSVMARDMVLQSAGTKNGKSELITEPVSGFLKSVAKPHNRIYDERVVFSDIKTDGNLASVWSPYKFYLGDQFSHCGVDVFQLIKSDGTWKIIYIVDTRRKDNCPE